MTVSRFDMKLRLRQKKYASRVLALGLLSGVMLSACYATPSVPTRPSTFANPIQISESIERLELYSRPNGMELSARDQDAVASFIAAYGQFGDGPLYINVPRQLAGGMGTKQAENIVRQAAVQMGVSQAVQAGQYQSRPGAPAPVVVSYRRLKSVPRNCRALSDMVSTDLNLPYAGWGCAHNANLAAMVQNPRQFLEPYGMGPSNAERRLEIHDKYIEGEITASEFPERQIVNVDSE